MSAAAKSAKPAKTAKPGKTAAARAEASAKTKASAKSADGSAKKHGRALQPEKPPEANLTLRGNERDAARQAAHNRLVTARYIRALDIELDACCPSVPQSVVVRLFRQKRDAHTELTGKTCMLTETAAAALAAHGGQVIEQLVRGGREVLACAGGRSTLRGSDVRAVARIAQLIPSSTEHSPLAEIEINEPDLLVKRAFGMHKSLVGSAPQAAAKVAAAAAAAAPATSKPKNKK